MDFGMHGATIQIINDQQAELRLDLNFWQRSFTFKF
jgi:hypothetical protein